MTSSGYHHDPVESDEGVHPTRTRAGTVWPRAAARLIDFFLLGIANAVVVGILLVVVFFGGAGGLYRGYGYSGAASAVGSVLTAGISLAYFAGMESARGQTIGKSLMRLRTVSSHRGHPTLREAIRRNVWVTFGVLGVIPVIGGVVGSLAMLAAVIVIAKGIAEDDDARGWHDRFAGGTTVVSLPSSERVG